MVRCIHNITALHPHTPQTHDRIELAEPFGYDIRTCDGWYNKQLKYAGVR